jgi:hypothetical protein
MWGDFGLQCWVDKLAIDWDGRWFVFIENLCVKKLRINKWDSPTNPPKSLKKI